MQVVRTSFLGPRPRFYPPPVAYPLGFRAALGGFLVGCVELGMSGFSKWRALKVSISGSNSPKNRGETGIFAEDKAEIKDKGQQN